MTIICKFYIIVLWGNPQLRIKISWENISGFSLFWLNTGMDCSKIRRGGERLKGLWVFGCMK